MLSWLGPFAGMELLFSFFSCSALCQSFYWLFALLCFALLCFALLCFACLLACLQLGCFFLSGFCTLVVILLQQVGVSLIFFFSPFFGFLTESHSVHTSLGIRAMDGFDFLISLFFCQMMSKELPTTDSLVYQVLLCSLMAAALAGYGSFSSFFVAMLCSLSVSWALLAQHLDWFAPLVLCFLL
jgi:hypothetical protein